MGHMYTETYTMCLLDGHQNTPTAFFTEVLGFPLKIGKLSMTLHCL